MWRTHSTNIDFPSQGVEYRPRQYGGTRVCACQPRVHHDAQTSSFNNKIALRTNTCGPRQHRYWLARGAGSGSTPPDWSAPNRLQPFWRPLSRKPAHRDKLCTQLVFLNVYVAAPTSISIPCPCIRERSTFRPCHTRPSFSAAGRPDRTWHQHHPVAREPGVAPYVPASRSCTAARPWASISSPCHRQPRGRAPAVHHAPLLASRGPETLHIA